VTWKKAGLFSVREAETFLRKRERYCVNACYRYRREKGNEKIWYNDNALLLSVRNFLFPVFHFEKNDFPETLVLPLRLEKILKKEGLHAAQGLEADMELLESALEKLNYDPLEIINYDLMELEAEQFRPDRSPGGNFVIRIPEMKDVDALFPLQEGYEKEEVIPRGGVFSPAACRKSIENLIADNLILAAETEGRFVGKINLNAESFTRLQIGGVYVDPAYRNRGIARFMTQALMRRLVSRGKTFALFVRKSNATARRAYDSLGFTQFADYRITYY
jgi:predicted N-acetyltransferase YhbS